MVRIEAASRGNPAAFEVGRGIVDPPVVGQAIGAVDRKARQRLQVGGRRLPHRHGKALGYLCEKTRRVPDRLGGDGEPVISEHQDRGVFPNPLGDCLGKRQPRPGIGNEGVGNALKLLPGNRRRVGVNGGRDRLDAMNVNTTFCGISAWTVVSIDGLRPEGFRS